MAAEYGLRIFQVTEKRKCEGDVRIDFTRTGAGGVGISVCEWLLKESFHNARPEESQVPG